MSNSALTSRDVKSLLKYIYKRYGQQYRMMEPGDILNETILYMLENGKKLTTNYIAASTFYALSAKRKQQQRMDKIQNSEKFFFHEKQREEMYSFYSYKKKKDVIKYPIQCVTTGKLFKTTTEAAKFYKTSQGNISRCINGNSSYTTAGKYNGLPLQWKRLTKDN